MPEVEMRIKVKGFFDMYRKAFKVLRMQQVNFKWRAFVSLLALALLWGVWEYSRIKKGLMAEDFYEWFLAGLISGVVLVTMIYEGEFIIQVWNLLQEYRKQFEEKAKKIVRVKG